MACLQTWRGVGMKKGGPDLRAHTTTTFFFHNFDMPPLHTLQVCGGAIIALDLQRCLAETP